MNISLKRLLNKILEAPIIIESDTINNWTYRKWSDGTVECWGYYFKNVAANTTDSNNYISFPFEFSTTPIVTIGLRADGSDLYRAHITGIWTNQIRLTLINKYSTSAYMTVYMHAIGKINTNN